MLNDIDVIISTVWREDNYLKATLNSLFAEQAMIPEQQVCLVAGSPITTHLDCYRSNPGVTVLEMGANTWSWIKNSPVILRSSWNYYRCLNHDATTERGRLVLED